MEASEATVLIVDDDDLVRRRCAHVLRERYRVLEAEDGTAALESVEGELPDIIVLDWNMPGLSGAGLLQLLGTRWPHIPVVVITGYSDEEKAISAVEYAQGYLRKPFGNAELCDTVARVLEQCRRREGEPPPESHPRGDIAVSRLRCEVRIRGGEPIRLTATEYALLNALLARSGEVVPYRDLARAVVGREIDTRHQAAEICKHHVSSLRRKIEGNDGAPHYIRTIYRRGYMLLPNGIATQS